MCNVINPILKYYSRMKQFQSDVVAQKPSKVVAAKPKGMKKSIGKFQVKRARK